jgi:hypothetical protein
MRHSIPTLKKVGQISQIHNSQLLFKALLAPKPHQEHIHKIANLVWHFCVVYIPLNQVMHLIAYPIPCCDYVVKTAFRGFLMWLYDTIMGYQQLLVSTELREKLACQGPDAFKWTHKVMPFDTTNGPATIMMIHNVNSVQKNIASSVSLTVGVNVDTRIIINNITNGPRYLIKPLSTLNANSVLLKPTV